MHCSPLRSSLLTTGRTPFLRLSYHHWGEQCTTKRNKLWIHAQIIGSLTKRSPPSQKFTWQASMIRVNSKWLPKLLSLRNPCNYLPNSLHAEAYPMLLISSTYGSLRKPISRINCSRNNFPKTNASENGFPYARIGNNECHHRTSVYTMSRMSRFPHPLSMWDSSIQYRISYCTYSLFQNMPYNQLVSSNSSWWQSPEVYNEFNAVETQSVSAPPEWPWH